MVKSIVASYESQEKNGHKFRFSINLRRKLSSENFCRKRQGRRVRDEPSKGRVGGAGVPEEQRGPDALRRVSQGGPADHIESHGVDGEDVQLSHAGDREILVQARGRGDASTPRPAAQESSVDCTHQSSRYQRQTHGQPGLLGIASIRALSIVFTDSGVVNTFETSGSRATTSRSRSPRPTNRFGGAFR